MSETIKVRIGRDVAVVNADGSLVRPSARKARALIALMALSKNQTISRREAARLLWSTLDEAAASTRLRNTLHSLRRDLGLMASGFIVSGQNLTVDGNRVSIELVYEADVEENSNLSKFELLKDLSQVDHRFCEWLLYRCANTGRRGLHSVNRTSIEISSFEEGGGEVERVLAKRIEDDVITEVSKLRWVAVTQRASGSDIISPSQAYFTDAGRYKLNCKIRSGAADVELIVRLLDQANDHIVWSSTLTEASPLFNGAITLAEATAAHLETHLPFIEIERRRFAPSTEGHTAYSLVLQAIQALSTLDKGSFMRAGHALNEAVSIDQEFATAHIWRAYWHVFLVGQGWATDPHTAMTVAGEAALRAMFLDPNDARAVTAAGHVRAFLNKRSDEAFALHEQALDMNRALPWAWHFSGMAHAYAGNLDEAYTQIARSRALAPSSPFGFLTETGLAIVSLLCGDHEHAAMAARRATERYPNFTTAYRTLLSALGHLGRISDAGEVLQRFLRLEPNFTLRQFYATAPYRRKQDLEHFAGGLRLAGLL